MDCLTLMYNAAWLITDPIKQAVVVICFYVTSAAGIVMAGSECLSPM